MEQYCHAPNRIVYDRQSGLNLMVTANLPDLSVYAKRKEFKTTIIKRLRTDLRTLRLPF